MRNAPGKPGAFFSAPRISASLRHADRVGRENMSNLERRARREGGCHAVADDAGPRRIESRFSSFATIELRDYSRIDIRTMPAHACMRAVMRPAVCAHASEAVRRSTLAMARNIACHRNTTCGSPIAQRGSIENSSCMPRRVRAICKRVSHYGITMAHKIQAPRRASHESTSARRSGTMEVEVPALDPTHTFTRSDSYGFLDTRP